MEFENELHENLFNLFVIRYIAHGAVLLNSKEDYDRLCRYRSSYIYNFEKGIFSEPVEWEYKVVTISDIGYYDIPRGYYKSLDDYNTRSDLVLPGLILKAVQLIEHSKRIMVNE